MQANAQERIGFVPTAVVSLLTVAALALLGLVLAYWTWQLLAPRVEPRVAAAQVPDGGAADAYRLFGGAQTAAGGVAAAAGSVKLLGVVAASGSGPGYAVLRLDGKASVAVRAGGEVEPGLRLVEVHPDHVVLERKGAREDLAWPAAVK